jgi:hypothetical protein
MDEWAMPIIHSLPMAIMQWYLYLSGEFAPLHIRPIPV